MKKKTLLYLLLGTTLLVGCNGENTNNSNTQTNTESLNNHSEMALSENENTNKSKENKDIPEVSIDELPYQIETLEADSIGEVYGVATYVNNSPYPVKGFSLDGTLPSKNETTYFISVDTVLPGETSANFESNYEENTEIKKISYSYIKDDKEYFVEYDVKLDKYTETEFFD